MVRDYKHTPVPDESPPRSTRRGRRVLLVLILLGGVGVVVWNATQAPVSGLGAPPSGSDDQVSGQDEIVAPELAESAVVSDVEPLSEDHSAEAADSPLPSLPPLAMAADDGEKIPPRDDEPSSGDSRASAATAVESGIEDGEETAGRSPVEEAPQENSREDQARPPIDFSFYRTLRDYKVEIPKEELVKTEPKPARTTEGLPSGLLAPSSTTEVVARPVPAVPDDLPQADMSGDFEIQVGAFRESGQAEELMARLLLQGFDGRVVTGVGAGQHTWHRVRLGPYLGRESASRVKAVLATQGVKGVLLERR